MTHEEVYAELARDRESISRWWEHQRPLRRRLVLKARKLPVRIWMEHISPRKNRYLFFTRMYDKKMRIIPTGIIALRHSSDGLTAYSTWSDGCMLVCPMVILPHAFNRYAERCGVEKRGVELIKEYFQRNGSGVDSYNQDAFGRSVRYNGEIHLANCVTDGILLGQQQGDIFIVRTFITYDMCTGKQREEFNDKRKWILSDDEVYERFKRHYLNK